LFAGEKNQLCIGRKKVYAKVDLFIIGKKSGRITLIFIFSEAKSAEVLRKNKYGPSDRVVVLSRGEIRSIFGILLFQTSSVSKNLI